MSTNTGTLPCSVDRLGDPSRITLFKHLFLSHGVRGRREHDASFTERERIEVLPLVFGLLPRRAVVRAHGVARIKPFIVEHLASLGIGTSDTELIDIVKEVADQLYYVLRNQRKKWGVSKLRASDREMYRRLQDSQCNRCAVCGVLLGCVDETLDHKIPFRLLGDVPDGANWQLLCDKCNRGKSSWFSALQPPCVSNWAYDDLDAEEVKRESTDVESAFGRVGETLRYCVLASRRRCETPGCGRSAVNGPLAVVLQVATGLPVMDHMQVRCEEHAPMRGPV